MQRIQALQCWDPCAAADGLLHVAKAAVSAGADLSRLHLTSLQAVQSLQHVATYTLW